MLQYAMVFLAIALVSGVFGYAGSVAFCRRRSSPHPFRKPVCSGLLAAMLLIAASPAWAALTYTPLTWNVVGLDSNNVNVGPNLFPIGYRVCSTTSTGTEQVTLTWNWTTTEALINLRPGSFGDALPMKVGPLAAGGCADAYFEVQVTRNATAYNKTRRYTVTLNYVGSGGAVVTPTREVYVEKLVSQNRNTISSIKVWSVASDPTGVSPPAPAASYAVAAGQDYWIQLNGGTATQGYEQLATFVSFDNTIFQIKDVTTTFNADSSPYIDSPTKSLYLNGCLWENDFNLAAYRSCLGTGKGGGSSISVLYRVTINSVSGAAQRLKGLIYDFSGSSYHYNADSDSGSALLTVVSPLSSSISKSFTPATITTNGISTLNIRISNPDPITNSPYAFRDALPTNVVIAATPGVLTAGCGSAVSFTATAGAGFISASGISVAPASSCTVSVKVTSATNGTYNNTILYGTSGTSPTSYFSLGSDAAGVNAGGNASNTATLTVQSSAVIPACNAAGAETYALWDFNGLSGTTPPASTTPPKTSGTRTAVGFAGGDSGNTPGQYINLGLTGTTWGGEYIKAGTGDVTPLDLSYDEYFGFSVDTTGLSAVFLNFDGIRTPQCSANQALYVSSSPSSVGTLVQSFSSALAGTTSRALPVTTGINSGGTTYFRIYVWNANSENNGQGFQLDNVRFSSCSTASPPNPPSLTKAFSPSTTAAGAISRLTFTATNGNVGTALSNVDFSDSLPAGIVVASTPNASATGCGFTLPASNFAPTGGSSSIGLSGATIAAGSSCVVAVDVLAASAGERLNVSGAISSAESGTNAGASGLASAKLITVAPPVIAKTFTPALVPAVGTSKVTLTISNPNQIGSLSGISFTDTLPTSPGSMLVVAGTQTNTCGGTLTATVGSGSISLSAATLAASASCSISVPVSVPVSSNAIAYTNSVQVRHVINTVTVNGNTAIAYLTAPQASLALRKQIGLSLTGPWSFGINVTAGTNVFYQFTVENTGPVAISGLSVSDALLAGLTPPPTNTLAACNTSLNSAGALPVANATTEAHIRSCVVGPFAAGASPFTNTATATSTTPVITSNPSSASYAVVTNLPRLKTTKTLVSPTPPINYGELATYQVVVQNQGLAATAGTLFLYDDLGTDLTFVSYSGTNWTCSPNDPLTCKYNGAPLAAATTLGGTDGGSTTVLQITVRVETGAPNADNVARAIGGGDSLCPTLSFAADADCIAQVLAGTLPVTLSDVEVVVEGGQLVVRFGTASESGSMQYLVRSDVAGNPRGRQTVGNGVLDAAGSSLAPRRYEIRGPFVGQTSVWIEEQGIDGSKEVFGPFPLGLRSGERDLTSPIDWARVANEQSAFRLAQANNTASRSPAVALEAEIRVGQDGMVHLSHEQLVAAGIDWSGQAMQRLSLSMGSDSVPFEYQGADNIGPGSSVSFVASAVRDSLYTRAQVYRLSLDDSVQPLVRAQFAGAGANVATLTGPHQKLHAPKRQYDMTSAQPDPWTMLRMVRNHSPLTSYIETFELADRAVTSVNEVLELELHGGVDFPVAPDHSVRLVLNGQEIGHVYFDGLTAENLVIPLADQSLRSGSNVVRFDMVGDTSASGSVVYVDSIRASYQRQLTAVDNRIDLPIPTTNFSGRATDRLFGDNFDDQGMAACGPADGCNTYTVSGFTRSDLRAMLQLPNGSVSRLSGVRVVPAAGGYVISFTVGSPIGGRVWIAPADASVAVGLAPRLAPTDPLASGAANYLVISHPSFIQGLAPLVAARRAEGFSVQVVDVEAIYAYYSRGVVDPLAISAAVADAYARLGTRYVLLVGSDTYDYFNYSGSNSQSFIPTFYRALGPIVRFTPTDIPFADVDMDGTQDLAIGRLPVRTLAELDQMLAKMQVYAAASYGGRMLQLADRSLGGMNYAAEIGALDFSLGGTFQTSRIFMDNYPAGSAGLLQARADLVSAVGAGNSLLAYIGHSSPSSWSRESLVTASQVLSGLFNNPSTPTVAWVLGCYGGYFVSPSYNNVASALMAQANGGGAAAVIGTSALTSTASDIAWMNAMRPYLISDRIGDAMMKAQQSLSRHGTRFEDAAMSAQLLGDPAMRIKQ